MPRTTAAFLVETNEGPALVETGPESTYPVLARKLAKLGHAPEDVRHVFLTHIHLDHAGAAWRFAERGARIHVHPRGAEHLRDPSRLLASARRIFGVRTEELWGAPRPVAAESIEVVGDGATLHLGGVKFEAIETPGHAYHHHAWRVEGSVFTGDVGGVRIGDGPVFSPTPPPEIEVGLWRESIARLCASRPEELYLSHFGRFTDVAEHLEGLEACLNEWSGWMRARIRKAPYEAIAREFRGYVDAGLERAGLGPVEKEEYEFADPAWMNAQGLYRYWRQRLESDEDGG